MGRLLEREQPVYTGRAGTTLKLLAASKANRQINWDRLYYANQQAAKNGQDTALLSQAKHNDNLNLTLSSTLTAKVTKNSKLATGFMLGTNSNRHYQTMEDMLGGSIFHNINTYALGNYPSTDPRVQYDLNTAGPNNTGNLSTKATSSVTTIGLR